MSSKFRNELYPLLALLFTASLWGILWYPLRLLEEAGIQGLWSTLIIYLAALAVGFIPAIGRFRELARQPGLMLLLAITSGWTNIAFILAVLDGNVVRVLLLFYMSPVWATLLGFFLLKERASNASLVVLVLAMTGAVIMLWDSQLGYPWPKTESDWLAISSGISFAFANVFTRKSQLVSIQAKTVAAWAGVVIISLTWILVEQLPIPTFTVGSLTGAITLGVLGITVMTWTVLYGVSQMPVYRSSVILLFELVAGAVSAQLLTDEIVLLKEWIGGGIIIFAAYLSARIHLRSGNENNK